MNSGREEVPGKEAGRAEEQRHPGTGEVKHFLGFLETSLLAFGYREIPWDPRDEFLFRLHPAQGGSSELGTRRVSCNLLPVIHPVTLDGYLGFHSFSHLSNSKLVANYCVHSMGPSQWSFHFPIATSPTRAPVSPWLLPGLSASAVAPATPCSPGAGRTMSLEHGWSCSSPASEPSVPNLLGEISQNTDMKTMREGMRTV